MIIAFIFCIIGIVGFFNDIMWLTYVGMGLAIVDHLLGVVSGAQKSLTTLWIALFVSVLVSGACNSLLDAVAICICFENIICFSLGILLMLVYGVANISKNKNDK